jgi:hypothetical protein
MCYEFSFTPWERPRFIPLSIQITLFRICNQLSSYPLFLHPLHLFSNIFIHLIGKLTNIYNGSFNSALNHVASLSRPAVRANAASIILIHNHPSGDPTPSPEDAHVTRSIVEAGKMIDVDVLDHIVIGQGHFTSLKAKRLGFN